MASTAPYTRPVKSSTSQTTEGQFILQLRTPYLNSTIVLSSFYRLAQIPLKVVSRVQNSINAQNPNGFSDHQTEVEDS